MHGSTFYSPSRNRNRGDLLTAYHKRLTSGDDAVRRSAARAWSVSSVRAVLRNLSRTKKSLDAYASDHFAEAFARIECHYFINNGFFENENQLLQNIVSIRHIPGIIVQGRYDVVCPAESAWELSQAWPEASLHLIQDAGHSVFEAGIRSRLVKATDHFIDNGEMI